MNIKWLIIKSFLLILTFSQIFPLNQQILKQIFQQSKQYLIYIHGDNYNIETEAAFFSYCLGEKLCAVLNPTYQGYYEMLQFIGVNLNQYFFIYSPLNKRKYVLPALQEITQNSLLQFQYKYLHGQLDPFFSSEQLPESQNQRCIKIVGKNLGEFLRGSEQIKIIFLYAINRQCQSCDAILQNYLMYAQKHYVQGKIAFGYYNTFLNDHPAIVDEKTPNILAFIGQQWKNSYQISPEDLQTLTIFINKIANRNNQHDNTRSKIIQTQDL